VSRPFSAFYTVNWIEIERSYFSHSEKKDEETISNSLVVVVVVARAARPPAFLSTFLNQKTEKQFFLIYVGDIFRGPDSIVISHGLFQSFSFSVSQKCYGNVSTKHHTHRCQLRRVISSFLYSAKKKKGKDKKNVTSKKTRSWVGKLWLDQYYSTGFFFLACVYKTINIAPGFVYDFTIFYLWAEGLHTSV
jgi:hypothetical protein